MKTKLTKTLYLVIVLSSITLLAIAQSDESVISKLRGKNWVMQGLTDKIINDKYVKNHIIHSIDGKHLATDEFYLSNSIDTIFDTSKMNKLVDGKYIILRSVKGRSDNKSVPVTVLEIIVLENERLVFKNKRNNIIEFKAY